MLSLPEITTKPALMKYIDLDSSSDDPDNEREIFYCVESGIDNASSTNDFLVKQVLDSDTDELFGAQGFVDV